MTSMRPRLTRSRALRAATADQLALFMLPGTPARVAGSRDPQLPARRTAAVPQARPSAIPTPIRALPRPRTGLPPDALTAAAASVPLVLERTLTGAFRLASPALPGRLIPIRPGDRAGLGLAAVQFLTEAEAAGYSARRSRSTTTRPITGRPTTVVAGAKFRTKHDPRDWEPPNPDHPGKWRSPAGLLLPEGTQVVQRARARRAAAGITDPPPEQP